MKIWKSLPYFFVLFPIWLQRIERETFSTYKTEYIYHMKKVEGNESIDVTSIVSLWVDKQDMKS